jgi:hypothetical protein
MSAALSAEADGVRDDWRRDPAGREAALDERRWPALTWVLWIVSSFSVASMSLTGEAGGDLWNEFFRIPGTTISYLPPQHGVRVFLFNLPLGRLAPGGGGE